MSQVAVSTMGQNSALVVMSKDGQEARRIVTPCKLSVVDKTLTKAGPMGIIVSATGYSRIAAQSNGLVYAPPTVVANSESQPNGYTDPVTGDMFTRRQFAAYTTMGMLYYTDRTVVFNARQKNLEDFLTKAKNNPNICKVRPTGMGAPDKDGTWAKYSVNDSVDLYMDCSTQEVIKWLIEEKRNVQFGCRKAQTMSERNAIKSHPVVAIPNAGSLTAEEVIKCSAWFTPSGPLRIDETTLSVDITKRLGEGDGVQGDSRVIDVTEVEEDDHAAAEAEEAATEEGAPLDGGDIPFDDPDAGMTDRVELERLRKTRGGSYDAAVGCVCGSKNVTIAEMKDGQVIEILKMLHSAA